MNVRPAVVLFAAILLPGAVLAPAWTLAGLGAGEDDVLYYFPMRFLFGELIRAGEPPWYNPWTGLGRPYLADPQTAVWYPFTWLFAVLPPLVAYPLSLWAHYAIALWGMYRLLRGLAVEWRVALFGGLAFAFSGFLLAHRAHLSMQHAAAWVPWILWALQRCALPAAGPVSSRSQAGPAAGPRWLDWRFALAHRARGQPLRRLAVAVAAITLQCLAGHVQIAALTALAAPVYLLAGPAGAGSRATVDRVAGRALRVIFARWLPAYALAGALFAVQWLPTLAYLRLCTRSDQGYEAFVENSWNPAAALTFVLPMLFGQRTPNVFAQPWWGPSHQVEQFAYAGLVPLVLAAVALRSGVLRDPRRRGLAALGLFGLLLALGEFGPLCPLLFHVPGSSVFRVPARALVLVNLAIAGLAAVGLNDLLWGPVGKRAAGGTTWLARRALHRWTRWPILSAAALIAVPLLAVLAAMLWLPAETRAAARRAVQPWNPAVWLPLLVAIISLSSLGVLVRRRPARQARSVAPAAYAGARLWLPILVTVIDLGVIGWTLDVPRLARDTRAAAALVTPSDAAWMDEVRESGTRLWVVTGRAARWVPGEYVRPVDKAAANTNILRGIPALTDYGPLQPRGYVAAFGFRPWGEAEWAAELLVDTTWMRVCNVGWVLLVDEYWPEPAGGDLALTTPAGWRLYRMPQAAGNALVDPATAPAAVRMAWTGSRRFITGVDTWPAAADAAAGATGAPAVTHRLVVALLALPGWSARSGDRVLAIEPYDGLLLSVPLPPGQPLEIEWSYSPPGLWPGATLSLLTLAALAGALIWRR